MQCVGTGCLLEYRAMQCVGTVCLLEYRAMQCIGTVCLLESHPKLCGKILQDEDKMYFITNENIL